MTNMQGPHCRIFLLEAMYTQSHHPPHRPRPGFQTGGRRIKRNRIQVQLAPSPHHSMDSPSGSQPEQTLADKLLPNSLTAMTPTSQHPPRTATTFSATPSSVPYNPVSSTVDETPLTASPSPPCSVTQPPTLRQVSPISSSPSLPRPQTVTRSGRVIRHPARYAG